METSEIVHTIETLHKDARSRGLFFQNATDDMVLLRLNTELACEEHDGVFLYRKVR